MKRLPRRACRKRWFPNPEEAGFLQLAKAPPCESLMIAAKAQSLRWLVAARRLSQAEADRRLLCFRLRLETNMHYRRVAMRKRALRRGKVR
jgi:hypothetical protein